ncbi:DUF6364 family protein, partial [Arthrospira platensis SPKY1]|nr:DUF6364 family protein [Arthrospira platensis SPKY1]
YCVKQKLTLTLDPSLIERAHRFAKQEGTSLSRLVEAYLSVLINSKRDQAEEEAADYEIATKTPITDALAGLFASVHVSEEGLKSLKTQRLEEKYLETP